MTGGVGALVRQGKEEVWRAPAGLLLGWWEEGRGKR
jgi:hypothetical protein